MQRTRTTTAPIGHHPLCPRYEHDESASPRLEPLFWHFSPKPLLQGQIHETLMYKGPRHKTPPFFDKNIRKAGGGFILKSDSTSEAYPVLSKGQFFNGNLICIPASHYSTKLKITAWILTQIFCRTKQEIQNKQVLSLANIKSPNSTLCSKNRQPLMLPRVNRQWDCKRNSGEKMTI